MTGRIHGKRIAFLVEDGFDAALAVTRDRLLAEGADVVLIGPKAGATLTGSGGTQVTADRAATTARIADFDAVVIPGGHAPDRIRMRHAMVDLTREAMTAGKPVAAIGHGPQVLITASVLRGRTLTCWPSIAVDVMNAGGLYVDRPVVEDGNLITSRKPGDAALFADALVRSLTQ